MSLAETEMANVESIARPQASRFGRSPLAQFAIAGLALTIVDFRKMCEELCAGDFGTPHEIADTLYAWMTSTRDRGE